MREIKLTKNQTAIIDNKDFNLISKYNWYAVWNKTAKTFYACNHSKRYVIFMHRMIMGIYYGDPREIDHKNHNGLDNRRENLTITDERGNAQNREKKSIYGTGIAYRPKHNKTNPYQVHSYLKGKPIHIGVYKTLEDAKLAKEKWLMENTNAIA